MDNSAIANRTYESNRERCEIIRWTIFPSPFTSLLMLFSHPARYYFGAEWEPRVVTLIGHLRSQGELPTFQGSWTPLGRSEWPKI